MTATAAQIARLAQDWKRIASETVEVEQIGNTFYGFASELATLRLLKAYRTTDAADCGFSENLGRFFFRLGAAV